jgi:hypothetical protein
MRLYAVDTDDPDDAREMNGLARMVARIFSQQAVYLTHEEIGASLVYPERVTA